MPEDIPKTAEKLAPESSDDATMSEMPSSSASTSLALPIVEDGGISLRVPIDFQSLASPTSDSPEVRSRAVEGGSEDTKGAGGRTFRPESSATS